MIEAKNLTKKFDSIVAVDHIDARIKDGCVFGLIGTNGAGKSTFLRMACGVLKPDEGTIQIDGEDVYENAKVKGRFFYISDDQYFFGNGTPQELMAFYKSIYPSFDVQRATGLLESFSLDRRRKISTFSKGMKKQLSVILGLCANTEYLFCDETFDGLDPVMRDDILDIFLDYIQDENHSILMSSHITTDLEKIADYVTFIHEGKIVFSKTKDELIYNYGILRCSKDDFDRIDPGDILAYRKEDYQWNVLVADRDKAMAHYRNVIVDHPTIDDILLLYVKGEASK